MSITQITTSLSRNELHPLGSIANLGATVLDGDVQAFAKGSFGAPTDPVSAGYFGMTRGTFRMRYPFNEQATVVQGCVRLTDVVAGTSMSYAVGDSWFVTQGTEVLWEIQSDFFIKHFFAVVEQ